MLKITGNFLVIALCFVFIVSFQVFASNEAQFNQTISAGSLSVDVVDGSGDSVGSPSVAFGAAVFSFDTQDVNGTFGTATEKIRALNPTSTATWTINLAASNTTDTWVSGSNHYDFNDSSGYTDGADADSYGGQLTIDPSGGTITGVSGCSTDNVSKGTSDSFVEGSVNSIDIMSATSGAATFCRWDFVGDADNITQKLPAGQAPGSYSLAMILSIQ